MDMQALFNAIAGIVLSAGGWFACQLWVDVKELRGVFHRIERDLPKTYVMKVDLDKRMEHIENMFQRIYDKLEAKADK